eukprot:g1713.t1
MVDLREEHAMLSEIASNRKVEFLKRMRNEVSRKVAESGAVLNSGLDVSEYDANESRKPVAETLQELSRVREKLRSVEYDRERLRTSLAKVRAAMGAREAGVQHLISHENAQIQSKMGTFVPVSANRLRHLESEVASLRQTSSEKDVLISSLRGKLHKTKSALTSRVDSATRLLSVSKVEESKRHRGSVESRQVQNLKRRLHFTTTELSETKAKMKSLRGRMASLRSGLASRSKHAEKALSVSSPRPQAFLTGSSPAEARATARKLQDAKLENMRLASALAAKENELKGLRSKMLVFKGGLKAREEAAGRLLRDGEDHSNARAASSVSSGGADKIIELEKRHFELELKHAHTESSLEAACKKLEIAKHDHSREVELLQGQLQQAKIRHDSESKNVMNDHRNLVALYEGESKQMRHELSEAQLALQRSRSEVSDLRTEIEFLSTSLQEERQSAMTERKTAEDRLRSTLRAGEVHRSNLDEALGKLKHAEKRAEQLKMQQAEDEKKHSSRIAQLERDNSMLLSSKKEAERLLKEHSAALEETKRDRDLQLSDLETEAKAAKVSKAELDAELQELRDSRRAEVDELAERSARLENDLERKERRLEGVGRENRLMKEELQQSREELDAASRSIEERDSQIKSLKMEVAKARYEKEDLMRELEGRDEKFAQSIEQRALQARLAEAQNRSTEELVKSEAAKELDERLVEQAKYFEDKMETSQRIYEEKLAHLEETHEKLQQRHERAKSDLRDVCGTDGHLPRLRRKLKELTSQVTVEKTQLAAELSQESARRTDAEAKLALAQRDLKTAMNERKQESDEAKTRLEDLHRSMSEKTNHLVGNYDAKLRELRETLSSDRKRAEDVLRKEIDLSHGKIMRLEEDLSAARQSLDLAHSERTAIEKTMAEMESKLAESESRSARQQDLLVEKLRQSQSKQGFTEAQLEAQKSKTSDEIARLRSRIADFESAAKSSHEQLVKIRQEHLDAVRKLEDEHRTALSNLERLREKDAEEHRRLHETLTESYQDAAAKSRDAIGRQHEAAMSAQRERHRSALEAMRQSADQEKKRSMDRIEKMEKDAARIQREHSDMLSAAAAREKALR